MAENGMTTNLHLEQKSQKVVKTVTNMDPESLEVCVLWFDAVHLLFHSKYF